jgi:hypothetical protein
MQCVATLLMLPSILQVGDQDAAGIITVLDDSSKGLKIFEATVLAVT